MWTTEKQKPVAHIPTASTTAAMMISYTIFFEQEKMHLNDSTFGVLTKGSTLEIKKRFHETRETLTITGQPTFSISDQVYILKSEIASALFTIRSILDSVSTLLQFLYGSKSNQYSSFSDFIKKASGQKTDDSRGRPDNIMEQYIKSNMEWFFVMRDIRDYVTHHGSIDISFYEDQSGSLLICVQNRFDLDALINSITSGLEDFLKFFDDHFASRIISGEDGAKR